MRLHRVSPGQFGLQSVLAPSPRQVGPHKEMISASAKSPKVQGQEVICNPDGRKRSSGLASRLQEPWPEGSGHTDTGLPNPQRVLILPSIEEQ